MRYVYINNKGKVSGTVDTGDSSVLPVGAIQWPKEIPFNDALNYGYDSTIQNFIKYDATTAPTEYHEFNFTTHEWVVDLNKVSQIIREKRDWLLLQMDMSLANPLRWAEMSDERKNSWANYRNELLAVPQQSGFPLNVNWPIEPK